MLVNKDNEQDNDKKVIEDLHTYLMDNSEINFNAFIGH